MATPTLPSNQSRIFNKIVSLIVDPTRTVEQEAGSGTVGYLKRRVWICAGAPTGAFTTGMELNDLILDTTNDNVYRAAAQPATGVYVELTATA